MVNVKVTSWSFSKILSQLVFDFQTRKKLKRTFKMSEIKNSEDTIKSLQKLLLEKDQLIADKDQEIAEKGQEISQKNVEINDKDKQIKTILNLDSVTMVSRFMELDVTNRQKIAQLENDIVDLEVKAVEADKNLTDAMEEVRQSKEEGSKRDIATINRLHQEIIKKNQEIAKKDNISRQIVQEQEQEIIKFIY